jgi:hypothetical protein
LVRVWCLVLARAGDVEEAELVAPMGTRSCLQAPTVTVRRTSRWRRGEGDPTRHEGRIRVRVQPRLVARWNADGLLYADAIVDEAMGAGLDGSDPITVHVKQLRAELLSVKGDLERELERVVLDCTVCGRTVQYVGGLGVRSGHWRTPNRRHAKTPKLKRDARSTSLKAHCNEALSNAGREPIVWCLSK